MRGTGAIAPPVCHPERSEGSHYISGCSLVAAKRKISTFSGGCSTPANPSGDGAAVRLFGSLPFTVEREVREVLDRNGLGADAPWRFEIREQASGIERCVHSLAQSMHVEAAVLFVMILANPLRADVMDVPRRELHAVGGEDVPACILEAGMESRALAVHIIDKMMIARVQEIQGGFRIIQFAEAALKQTSVGGDARPAAAAAHGYPEWQ